MTMERDRGIDRRIVDEASQLETASDAEITSGSPAFRYASRHEALTILDEIMDERAEVFRKLAQ